MCLISATSKVVESRHPCYRFEKIVVSLESIVIIHWMFKWADVGAEIVLCVDR